MEEATEWERFEPGVFYHAASRRPTHWLVAEISRWTGVTAWNEQLQGPELRKVEHYRGRFEDADDVAASHGATAFRHGDPLDHPAPTVYRYYRSELPQGKVVTVFIQGRKLSEYEGSDFVRSLPMFAKAEE